MNDSVTTKYLEFKHIPMVSKGWTDGNKAMIVMHGLGDSLDSYVEITKEINVTGLHYLLVNAPTPYLYGHSWYDLQPGNPHKGIIRSSQIILNIITELKQQGFESSDIFLFGFSQGGCIALETFYQLEEKLGGIIALSPRMYEERMPNELNEFQKKTPIFSAHGHYDQAIPFLETKSCVQKLMSLDAEIVFKEYEMEHTIDYYEIMDLRVWLNEYL